MKSVLANMGMHLQCIYPSGAWGLFSFQKVPPVALEAMRAQSLQFFGIWNARAVLVSSSTHQLQREHPSLFSVSILRPRSADFRLIKLQMISLGLSAEAFPDFSLLRDVLPPKPRMRLKKCYDVLGVDSTATPDDIKIAYKSRIREVHPDINPAPDAHARTQLLIEAYQTVIAQLAGDESVKETPIRLLFRRDFAGFINLREVSKRKTAFKQAYENFRKNETDVLAALKLIHFACEAEIHASIPSLLKSKVLIDSAALMSAVAGRDRAGTSIQKWSDFLLRNGCAIEALELRRALPFSGGPRAYANKRIPSLEAGATKAIKQRRGRKIGKPKFPTPEEFPTEQDVCEAGRLHNWDFLVSLIDGGSLSQRVLSKAYHICQLSAWHLGYSSDSRAIAPLMRLSTHEFPYLRRYSILSLSRLGDHSTLDFFGRLKRKRSVGYHDEMLIDDCAGYLTASLEQRGTMGIVSNSAQLISEAEQLNANGSRGRARFLLEPCLNQKIGDRMIMATILFSSVSAAMFDHMSAGSAMGKVFDHLDGKQMALVAEDYLQWLFSCLPHQHRYNDYFDTQFIQLLKVAKFCVQTAVKPEIFARSTKYCLSECASLGHADFSEKIHWLVQTEMPGNCYIKEANRRYSTPDLRVSARMVVFLKDFIPEFEAVVRSRLAAFLSSTSGRLRPGANTKPPL